MFAFVEESRALILRQSILENTKNQAFSPPDSTTLARLQELKQTVLTTEIALQLLKDEEVPETDRTFIALHAKLFDLKERLTLFNQELASNQEGYFETVVSPSSVTRGQLQEALRISNQALLEYFVGDSSIFIFIIQADNYEVLEVRRDFPLADWVHQFRAGVSKPYAAGLKSYTKAAYQLYEKLFAPLGNNLPERLVIIPDGDLGYVPFDVLLTAPPDSYYEPENFAYLLRRHQISYSYSATFLLRMQEKQHRNPSKANLLAMAPFSGVDTVLSSQLNLGDFLSDIRTVDTLMPLPFSRLEVDSLRTLFGATSLYGKSATKVNFLQLATQFRILHLATHGKADALAGDYSYLVFAPQLDSLANELLYVRDIYNLELNSDLVVLSACETGIGQLQRGEGMISLARAFAYAGAKSITTTLWQVSDRSTQELMTLYYRHLFSGLHNDLALQQTKLSYLKSNTGAAAHPALWAAFIGIGDMRPIY
jgi:CHAT domain-containing protein